MKRSGLRVGCAATSVLAILTMSSFSWAQSKDDIRKIMKEHESRPDTAPKVGSEAPNFKLKVLDGDKELELSSFKGKKPVVLVFGSYT